VNQTFRLVKNLLPLLKTKTLKRKTRSSGKALFQFYLLVVYILLQFFWWAYLIAQLNKEVHDLKVELVNVKGEGNTKEMVDTLNGNLYKRWLMIGGEGTVFSLILTLGILQTRKSFKREANLASMQKNFLMSVTHELKTPIASLRLQIETMMKRNLEKEHQEKILKLALEETERLNALVEKVLLANRLDAEGFPISHELVKISEIHSWLKTLGHAPWLKNHVFLIKLPADGQIETDYLSLQSIIINLLENSTKYTPENSAIELCIELLDNGFLLRISDSGPGIPKEYHAMIFDKFFRIGSEETRAAKGTGLGLYIVKHLVKYMGGKVTMDSEKDKGTVFTLQFEY